MAVEGIGSTSAAITFAVYAALIYDIIAAVNSSPQTTEINAASRAPTLMKWVKIGMAQAALFGAIGAYMEAKAGRSVWPPLAGAGLAAGLLWAQYVYARNCGLRSGAPGTESY